MKHTLSALSLSLLLAGCGGGDGGQSNANQPWVGEGNGEGGETTENSPPSINGEPSGTLEVMFAEELRYSISTSDPDGDEVLLSLKNAPSWVSLTNENELVISPSRLKNADDVVLVASDGKLTTESEPFSVVVSEPNEIAYPIAVPKRTSLGDKFTLIFTSEQGAFIEDYGVEVTEESLKNGLNIMIPYPYKGSIIEGSEATFAWSHNEYIQYRRWIGDFGSAYAALGDDLQFPIELRRSYTPNAQSSAYAHLLTNRQGDNSNEVVLSERYAHQLNPAISASDIENLAAYYELAHTDGLLIGFNTALESDFDERRSQPGLSESLNATIEQIRLAESTLVSDAYWQELLRETKASLFADLSTNWSAKKWQLLEPVDARFGAAFGETLKLSDNHRYILKDNDNNMSWVSETGDWSIEEGHLFLHHDDVVPEKSQQILLTPDDVVELRDDMIRTLHIDYETAKRWSRWVFNNDVDELTFSLISPSKTRVGVSLESVNDDRVLRMENVGSITFEQMGERAEFSTRSAERLARLLPVSQETTFDFNSDQFQVILPWPDQDGELHHEGHFSWLDLTQRPLVRKRLSSVDNDSFTTTDWTVEYQEDKRQFVFNNPQHLSGSLNYTVSISDSPSVDGRSSGETNSRRYAAQAVLERSGDVVFEGPINITLHPEVRCEEASRCDPEGALSQSNMVWSDTDKGRYPSPATNGFIRVDILDSASPEGVVDYHYVPVKEGSDCLGNVTTCLVRKSADPTFKIESIDPKKNALWRLTPTTSVWAPVKVDNQSFSVWADEKEWRHFEAKRFEPDDELWRCSKVNPEVQSYLEATSDERSALQGNFDVCFD